MTPGTTKSPHQPSRPNHLNNHHNNHHRNPNHQNSHDNLPDKHPDDHSYNQDQKQFQQQQQQQHQQAQQQPLLQAPPKQPSQSQYNLHLGAYKTTNQLPQISHGGGGGGASHKSTHKSVRRAPKSVGSSSVSSPPLHSIKSKYSKSRRFDPLDVPAMNFCDYLLLLLYYLCLYAFFAALWYASWTIYLATTDLNAPRIPHQNLITIDNVNGSFLVADEQSAVGVQSGSGAGSFARTLRLRVNATKLLESFTDEQKLALSVMKCNETLVRMSKEMADQQQ